MWATPTQKIRLFQISLENDDRKIFEVGTLLVLYILNLTMVKLKLFKQTGKKLSEKFCFQFKIQRATMK